MVCIICSVRTQRYATAIAPVGVLPGTTTISNRGTARRIIGRYTHEVGVRVDITRRAGGPSARHTAILHILYAIDTVLFGSVYIRRRGRRRRLRLL